MKRGHLIALLLTLCALPLRAELAPVDATKRPTCTDGRPWSVWLLNESSATDCDTTAGGTSEAFCCCKDGAVAACASGGSGTSVALDLGDDSGGDSSALTEIATVNDRFNACTEGVADQFLIDFALIPPFQQYTPERPPVSPGVDGFREDFTGNAAIQTWTWGNQDSASTAYTFDSEILQGDSTNEEMRFRWVAASASNPAQQVFTVEMLYAQDALTASSGCAIGALVTGTTATPTAVEWLVYGDYATDNISFGSDTNYDISAGFSLHGAANTLWTIANYSSARQWLQLRYDDGSSFLSAYLSWDGFTWWLIGASAAISGDPLYWGYGVRDFAYCRIYSAQLRTDGNAEHAGEYP